MRCTVAWTAAAFLWAMVGCGPEDSASGRDQDGPADASGSPSESPPTDPHAPHWSYEGDEGPEAWASLHPDFQLCGQGRFQSPMDLERATSGGPQLLRHAYSPLPLHLHHNGHTVEMAGVGGGGIEIAGVVRALEQLHFHAPSEHTLGGESFPLEAHLVHELHGGEREVLAILFEEGPENPAYVELLRQLPGEAGQTIQRPEVLQDPAGLFSEESSYLRYAGSLTTPPCSEGVTWYVLATPVALSRDQIQRIASLMAPNHRPVQPAHGRTVEAVRLGGPD